MATLAAAANGTNGTEPVHRNPASTANPVLGTSTPTESLAAGTSAAPALPATSVATTSTIAFKEGMVGDAATTTATDSREETSSDSNGSIPLGPIMVACGAACVVLAVVVVIVRRHQNKKPAHSPEATPTPSVNTSYGGHEGQAYAPRPTQRDSYVNPVYANDSGMHPLSTVSSSDPAGLYDSIDQPYDQPADSLLTTHSTNTYDSADSVEHLVPLPKPAGPNSTYATNLDLVPSRSAAPVPNPAGPGVEYTAIGTHAPEEDTYGDGAAHPTLRHDEATYVAYDLIGGGETGQVVTLRDRNAGSIVYDESRAKSDTNYAMPADAMPLYSTPTKPGKPATHVSSVLYSTADEVNAPVEISSA